MRTLLFAAAVLLALACNNANKPMRTELKLMPYPETRKDNITDQYHGTEVADPYRWLENDTATEVKQWVEAQNQVTQNYLEQIPFRENIKNRLTEIWNFPKYSAPFKEGEYIFFFKNDGLQNQSVLYYQKGESGTPEVFLDPNKLSEDGTSALTALSVSKDHQYLAYGISKSGSDWVELSVVDIVNNKALSDKINWVKFSSIAWYKNGFYYGRYDEPVKGKEFSNQNSFQKIFYHTLGDPQSMDVLVYEDKAHPLRYFGAQVSEDGKYLFINVSAGTSGTEIWFKELNGMAFDKKPYKLLVKGFANNHAVIDNDGNRILLQTDLDAPRYRIVSVEAGNPEPQNWKDLIPQSENLLEYAGTGGGKLFVSYLKDASSKVFQYDYSGKLEHEIELPGIGTSGGFGCRKEDNEFYYSFVSFTNPGSIYKYDIKSGTSKLFRQTEVKFKPEDFETKQVLYTSKDGTKVPMFILFKKGIELNGNNPTMLYGYGGFNISLTPSFSISRMLFLEQGGVYAIANLRGGGEYGEDWHKAGMLDKKQNVFDDFIAAAEYLIKEKYTNNDKLAINGGSNGGLLVGACMTQRPEMFKVAIPSVGVLDMLRYQTFTAGWGWVVEYGTSDSASHFDYLIKYSPLHNVKETGYPATLIMTADHDDRVVPAHSFKFAATLQSKHKGKNPLLIRIDTKAGHGSGKPTAKLIEDATDMWSFVLWNLGVDFK